MRDFHTNKSVSHNFTGAGLLYFELSHQENSGGDSESLLVDVSSESNSVLAQATEGGVRFEITGRSEIHGFFNTLKIIIENENTLRGLNGAEE